MRFMLLILIAVLSFSCASVQTKPRSGLGAYSIMQGVSGPTWSRINLVRPAADQLRYSLQTNGQKAVSIEPSRTHSWKGSDWVIDEFAFSDLQPGQKYTFQVYEADGVLVDERRFSSLAPSSGLNRFAVVSCSHDGFAEQSEQWKALLEKKPQWILAIGDNVYADFPRPPPGKDVTPEQVWNRYVETRNVLEIYRSQELVPVIGLWDDHDFGMNNGGADYVYKSEVTEIFQAFYPQAQAQGEFQRGPGISSRWQVGSQAFYLLDARSFRSAGAPSPACLKKPSHDLCKNQSTKFPEKEQRFSPEQEKWLFERLKKDRSGVIWLAQGDQWFGAYQPFESFDGRHPESFQRFMRALKATGKKVAFLSGDRHSSEISRIEPSLLGYETFEVVSSPIHAKVYPSNWVDFPNPRQVVGVAQKYNFTLIEAGKGFGEGIRVLNYAHPNQLQFNQMLMLPSKAKGKRK